jgi:hypothetical protein
MVPFIVLLKEGNGQTAVDNGCAFNGGRLLSGRGIEGVCASFRGEEKMRRAPVSFSPSEDDAGGEPAAHGEAVAAWLKLGCECWQLGCKGWCPLMGH